MLTRRSSCRIDKKTTLALVRTGTPFTLGSPRRDRVCGTRLEAVSSVCTIVVGTIVKGGTGAEDVVMVENRAAVLALEVRTPTMGLVSVLIGNVVVSSDGKVFVS